MNAKKVLPRRPMTAPILYSESNPTAGSLGRNWNDQISSQGCKLWDKAMDEDPSPR